MGKQTRLAGGIDIPLQIVDEQRLVGLDAKPAQDKLEDLGLRLPHADLGRDHDIVEQTGGRSQHLPEVRTGVAEQPELRPAAEPGDQVHELLPH